MGLAKLKPLSEAEYLSIEEHAPQRHEFVGGEMHAMAGASERHNIVSGNLFAFLHGNKHRNVQGHRCLPFIADMKLRIPRDGAEGDFYYPDVMLVCEASDDHPMIKALPCLVAEVMSPSTEAIDRREKLRRYQQISSVREVLLLSQDESKVLHYVKASAAAPWMVETLTPPDTLRFVCLDAEVAIAQLYDGI